MKKVLAMLIAGAVLITCNAAICASKAPADVQALLGQIKGTQEKVKDMSADFSTTVIIAMKIQGKEDTQKLVQKGKIWTKKPKKSRLEVSSPQEQIIITNGDKMMMINKSTGAKTIQDLKKLREQQGMSQGQEQDIAETMKQFDLKITNRTADEIVVTGVPKKKTEGLAKMVFVIDAKRSIPTRISTYNEAGALVIYTTIDYKNVSGLWAPSKTNIEMNSAYGSSKAVMELTNIKINKNISEDLFKIE